MVCFNPSWRVRQPSPRIAALVTLSPHLSALSLPVMCSQILVCCRGVAALAVENSSEESLDSTDGMQSSHNISTYSNLQRFGSLTSQFEYVAVLPGLTPDMHCPSCQPSLVACACALFCLLSPGKSCSATRSSRPRRLEAWHLTAITPRHIYMDGWMGGSWFHLMSYSWSFIGSDLLSHMVQFYLDQKLYFR